MISSALRHFPQIRFQGDEKLLWNPVLKKQYKQRPEERVRLQLIEFFLKEADFSKNRISFESPVSLPGDKSASRSDIICYDQTFEPFLLVECKAPSIQLDEQTAIQIARYNSEINAPFLMITNGMRDFWFKSEGSQMKTLPEIPSTFLPKQRLDRSFEYWRERGFAGTIEEPTIRHWITSNSNQLFVQPSNPVRFFPFEGSNPELYLANYYQVILINEQARLAVSFTSTPNQGTRFNVILNRGGGNAGLLSASLDLISSGESQNTIIQSASGNRMVDLVSEIGFDFRKSIKDLATQISELIVKSANE